MVNAERRSVAAGQTGDVGMAVHLSAHVDGKGTTGHTGHIERNGFHLVLAQIIDTQQMGSTLSPGHDEYVLSVKSSSPRQQRYKGGIYRIPQVVVGVVVYFRFVEISPVYRHEQSKRHQVFPKSFIVDHFHYDGPGSLSVFKPHIIGFLVERGTW